MVSGTDNLIEYVDGDNLRSYIGAGTGSGTMSSFTLAGDSGSNQTIQNTDTLTVAGGTYMASVASATDTVTLNHDSTTRNDTTSNASPGSAGTFTAVDSVTSNATGHVTAINVKTVTMPTSPTVNNNTITLAAGTGLSGGGSFPSHDHRKLNHRQMLLSLLNPNKQLCLLILYLLLYRCCQL